MDMRCGRCKEDKEKLVQFMAFSLPGGPTVSLCGKCLQDMLNSLAEPTPATTKWDRELMYKHRAFKQPRFEDLGPVSAGSYEAVLAAAKQEAEMFLARTIPEKDLESWEVRVRPAQK